MHVIHQLPDGIMIENIDEGGSMALVICPECGKEVSDNAERCPHCGNDMQPEKTARMKRADALQGCGCSMMLLPVLVILVIFAVICIIGMFKGLFMR